jgi:protein SCO1
MRSNLIKHLVFLISVMALGSCGEKRNKLLLPVYGEKKANGVDTVYHTISDFNLVNQDGEVVTRSDIDGKIVVANFFFATCQSICPEMSGNLVNVQDAFADDDSLKILSHSVNPAHDTVEVLKGYAQTYGARSGKWHLLTGDKKQIYELAMNSYLVNALEDDGSEEGFLHSELLLIVDPQGRIRGMYDGTDKGQVNRLIEDIGVLKREIAAGKN